MKKLFSIILCVAMIFSLAACTPNTPTSTPTPAATSDQPQTQEPAAVPNSQGVTDTEILIGNCAATSGAFGPVGIPYIFGLEAYVKMINEQGGVNGRTITFIHYDDEMNPEKGKASYDKLINDDKVFAIVGCFGTPVVGAVVPDFKEVGIPAVYFATGMSMLFNENATGADRVIYPVQPIYTTEGILFAAWAQGTFDASKVGIIYSGDDAGKGMYDGLNKKCAELGLELFAEQVPFGAEDVSAAVTKILSQGPDVVVIASMQNTFLTIGKELGKQGNTAPVLTSYVNNGPTYFSQFADDIKGKYEIYSPGWVDISKGGDETVQMAKYINELSPNEDYSNSPYAMSGWIAAKFFVEGLRRVGDDPITWENFMDALEESPIEMGFGSGSMIDYSDGKRYGTERLALFRSDMAFEGAVEMYRDFMTVDEILAAENN